MVKKVDLYEFKSDGTQNCTYGNPRTSIPKCGLPATHHILWINQGVGSWACDEHMVYIVTRDTRNNPYDTHKVDKICGMPNTEWKYSDNGVEGFCFMSDGPNFESVMKEAEPLVASMR